MNALSLAGARLTPSNPPLRGGGVPQDVVVPKFEASLKDQLEAFVVPHLVFTRPLASLAGRWRALAY